MAEAFLKIFAGDRYEVESAGIEAGNLNPIVVDAMAEIDIDISDNETNNVMDFYKQGKDYDIVITVCDKKAASKCPVFPGEGDRYHWPFEDPSTLDGDYQDKLETTRKIRDQIKQKVLDFIEMDKTNLT